MRFLSRLFLLLLLPAAAPLSAQLLKPTKTDAVVMLTVRKPDGQLLTGQKLTLENAQTHRQYTASTDLRGIAELLVPAGNNYILHFPLAKNFAQLDVPKKKYWTASFTATYDGKPVIADHSVTVSGDTIFFRGDSTQNLKADAENVLLHCTLTDYSGNALDSEVVTLYGLISKKYFKGITGKTGEVQLLLPKGDRYYLGFTYETHVDLLSYAREPGYRTAEVSYQYLGSREMKRRLAAEDLRLRNERDRQIEANRKEFEQISQQVDFYATLPKTPIDSGRGGKPSANDPDSVLLRAAKGYADPVVLNVLQRHSDWGATVVVTDLTGSMSPYTAQLAVWFREQLRYRGKLCLFFFNDGDGKPDAQKVIGATGGIHDCMNCNLARLDSTVKTTIAKGNGGDGPEDDVEALIRAVMQTKTTEPVVLVADNKAPVKDIALVESVHVPVRIILCSAEDTVIHPDYLRIAYATGGSLHTCKGDYTIPKNLAEGEVVTVAGYRYVYSRKRFLVLKEK